MSVPLRLTDEEYQFIYSRSPRLCVDLAIVADNGILMTMRAIEPAKGLWHLPGGRVHYKETLAQAAARIAESELGITIALGKFFTYIEFLNDGKFVHSVSLVFRAVQTGGTLRGSFQAQEVKIFNTVPENTHLGHKEFLTKNWNSIISPGA